MMVLLSSDGLCISIHTPARGVTDTASLDLSLSMDFNPHSRKGSDAITSTILANAEDFNPHSRKGSDNIFDKLFL